MTWRGRIALKLLPEPHHVHIGFARLEAACIPPNGLQYFFARYEPSGSAEKKDEKIVFDRSEADFLAVARDHPPVQVGFDAAEADHPGRDGRCPAQDGPQAREELS